MIKLLSASDYASCSPAQKEWVAKYSKALAPWVAKKGKASVLQSIARAGAKERRPIIKKALRAAWRAVSKGQARKGTSKTAARRSFAFSAGAYARRGLNALDRYLWF